MYNADNYSFPSIVLDKSGKIIAKNKAAYLSCPFFRKGSGIRSHITPLELGAMFKLKAGESILVKLKNEVGAIIFFDGESYLLRTNTLAVNAMSDISHLCDFSEETLKYFEVPSLLENPLLIRHSLFIQKSLMQYIKFKAAPFSVPYQMVDVSLILRNLVKACEEKLKGTRLSVTAENIAPSCFTVSSASHTEYSLLMSFALLFSLSDASHIIVNLFSSFNRVCLSIKAYADKVNDKLYSVMDILNTGTESGEKNDIMFYASYINAATALHGGNVNMEYTPVSGEINIRISYPLTKDDSLAFECDEKTVSAYSSLLGSIFYPLIDGLEFKGETK